MPDPATFIDPELPKADLLVLDTLLAERDQILARGSSTRHSPGDSGYESWGSSSDEHAAGELRERKPGMAHPDGWVDLPADALRSVSSH